MTKQEAIKRAKAAAKEVEVWAACLSRVTKLKDQVNALLGSQAMADETLRLSAKSGDEILGAFGINTSDATPNDVWCHLRELLYVTSKRIDDLNRKINSKQRRLSLETRALRFRRSQATAKMLFILSLQHWICITPLSGTS